ncbi:MarR family winged helix-turn-helix transcriptional regulator [Nonomuraea sp. NEAU-A123]|uniref:MarR family winged helix-turn-helix transcriptional regulator n=1 Tax=Nonomuraea sp. NEAU-A123 TaxID=2839649 RepID=UPI001BE3E07D|nr:MarR family transcriptional regulator [Nonomuraea sp. NEAU-A123]MBT2225324.1 MarR family transcriptional regulator [Nonomuraea sp. NEAU-A123]
MTTDSTPAGLTDDQPLNTVDALVQLSFLTQGIMSAVGAEYDLSIIQIRLLGILRDRQAGMLELGGHLGLDKSSMTGLVGRAEKRGLVQRSPSPHDGRAVLVSLTPLGRQLTERGAAEMSRRITGLIERRLTAAQRTQLTELATALVRAQPLT